MPGLFYGFSLRLRYFSFHWIISIGSGSHKQNQKKIEPFWLSLTLIFDFHWVRRAYDYDSDSDFVASENQP